MSRPKDNLAHRAPADCPVCGDHLSVTRLGCGSCGSELGGVFASCEYCALNDTDSDLLRVFLVSRGNMREVEKHLGVSYPTARARFTSLLEHLGLKEGDSGTDPSAVADVTAATPGSAGDPPDQSAHDQSAHDQSAHDQSAHDQCAPDESAPDQARRDEILASVASGQLSPAAAARLLGAES